MPRSGLFPAVDAAYRGRKAPFWFLVLVAVISTARSLIHIFAADGGAQSIAGLDVEVAGGANIVAMFGQWGASQLLLSLFYWLVLLRYRFLVPAALVAVLLEQLLRIGVGLMKPVEVAAPPPGEIGSYLLLPLSLIALLLSLRRRRR